MIDFVNFKVVLNFILQRIKHLRPIIEKRGFYQISQDATKTCSISYRMRFALVTVQRIEEHMKNRREGSS